VLLLAVPGPKQRLAHFLGGVSYPLYLNHWLGMAVAHSALKHLQVEERAAQAWLGYGLALAMASALYVLVDRRVLSRRDAWYDERLGRRVAWSAYVLTGFGLVAGAALLYTLP
jgi:peptidoglycan/LPS O-acetylase OafA/YrhL